LAQAPGDVIWGSNFPNSGSIGYRPDLPTAVVASSTKLFSVGTHTPIPSVNATAFAVTMYSPDNSTGPQTFYWPKIGADDTNQRIVRAATFCELQNCVIVTGDVTSNDGSHRVTATICVGLNDAQTKLVLNWSRIEDQTDEWQEPENHQAVAITANSHRVAVASVRTTASTGRDMMGFCYDVTTGASTCPRRVWNSGGSASNDVPVGISLLPANGGEAMVIGGTSGLDSNGSVLVLAAYQCF